MWNVAAVSAFSNHQLPNFRDSSPATSHPKPICEGLFLSCQSRQGALMPWLRLFLISLLYPKSGLDTKFITIVRFTHKARRIQFRHGELIFFFQYDDQLLEWLHLRIEHFTFDKEKLLELARESLFHPIFGRGVRQFDGSGYLVKGKQMRICYEGKKGRGR